MRSAILTAAAICLPLAVLGGCGGPPADVVAAAPPDPHPSEPPRIQIRQPERDLGEIPLDRHVEKFNILNTGGQPLVIHGLQASCGCVDVSLSRTTIAAGEKATLEVAIRPRQAEVRSTSIIVRANDPAAETRIALSWKARGPVTIEPAVLSFGVVRPGTKSALQVRVTQDLTQLGHARDLRMHGRPAGLFTTRRLAISRSDDKVEEEWQVELLVDPETVESNGTISVADASPDMPLGQIPATWQARQPIDVIPRTLFLGSAPPSEHVVRSVEVSSDADRSLEVERVEHIGSRFHVESEVVVLSPQRIQVTFRVVLPDAPGTYLERVNIVCREPFERTIELPLACVVLSPSTSATSGDVREGATLGTEEEPDAP